MREPIVTIPVGAEGIDYAWWRPTADQLKPWKYAVRYACKLPNGKAATPAEAQFILSCGTAFVLVWEQGAADWQQGVNKGTEHGRLAAQFAVNLGYPKGLAIIAAYDTNAASGDSRALAYGMAFADQVEAAGYTLGLYADLDVIRLLQGRSALNWLAGARSWSAPGPDYKPENQRGYELVHVRQVISGSTPNYDRNVTLRPFWAWLPHDVNVEVEPPVVPPAPIVIVPNPEEEPVRFVADSQSKGSAVVELVYGADKQPHHTMVGFNTAQERAVWASVLPVKPFDDATYLAMAQSASPL